VTVISNESIGLVGQCSTIHSIPDHLVSRRRRSDPAQMEKIKWKHRRMTEIGATWG
jgi:hypothetical protein